jgi:hypothetical protein
VRVVGTMKMEMEGEIWEERIMGREKYLEVKEGKRKRK